MRQKGQNRVLGERFVGSILQNTFLPINVVFPGIEQTGLAHFDKYRSSGVDISYDVEITREGEPIVREIKREEKNITPQVLPGPSKAAQPQTATHLNVETTLAASGETVVTVPTRRHIPGIKAFTQLHEFSDPNNQNNQQRRTQVAKLLEKVLGPSLQIGSFTLQENIQELFSDLFLTNLGEVNDEQRRTEYSTPLLIPDMPGSRIVEEYTPKEYRQVSRGNQVERINPTKEREIMFRSMLSLFPETTKDILKTLTEIQVRRLKGEQVDIQPLEESNIDIGRRNFATTFLNKLIQQNESLEGLIKSAIQNANTSEELKSNYRSFAAGLALTRLYHRLLERSFRSGDMRIDYGVALNEINMMLGQRNILTDEGREIILRAREHVQNKMRAGEQGTHSPAFIFRDIFTHLSQILGENVLETRRNNLGGRQRPSLTNLKQAIFSGGNPIGKVLQENLQQLRNLRSARENQNQMSGTVLDAIVGERILRTLMLSTYGILSALTDGALQATLNDETQRQVLIRLLDDYMVSITHENPVGKPQGAVMATSEYGSPKQPQLGQLELPRPRTQEQQEQLNDVLEYYQYEPTINISSVRISTETRIPGSSVFTSFVMSQPTGRYIRRKAKEDNPRETKPISGNNPPFGDIGQEQRRQREETTGLSHNQSTTNLSITGLFATIARHKFYNKSSSQEFPIQLIEKPSNAAGTTPDNMLTVVRSQNQSITVRSIAMPSPDGESQIIHTQFFTTEADLPKYAYPVEVVHTETKQTKTAYIPHIVYERVGNTYQAVLYRVPIPKIDYNTVAEIGEYIKASTPRSGPPEIEEIVLIPRPIENNTRQKTHVLRVFFRQNNAEKHIDVLVELPSYIDEQGNEIYGLYHEPNKTVIATGDSLSDVILKVRDLIMKPAIDIPTRASIDSGRFILSELPITVNINNQNEGIATEIVEQPDTNQQSREAARLISKINSLENVEIGLSKLVIIKKVNDQLQRASQKANQGIPILEEKRNQLLQEVEDAVFSYLDKLQQQRPGTSKPDFISPIIGISKQTSQLIQAGYARQILKYLLRGDPQERINRNTTITNYTIDVTVPHIVHIVPKEDEINDEKLRQIKQLLANTGVPRVTMNIMYAPLNLGNQQSEVVYISHISEAGFIRSPFLSKYIPSTQQMFHSTPSLPITSTATPVEEEEPIVEQIDTETTPTTPTTPTVQPVSVTEVTPIEESQQLTDEEIARLLSEPTPEEMASDMLQGSPFSNPLEEEQTTQPEQSTQPTQQAQQTEPAPQPSQQAVEQQTVQQPEQPSQQTEQPTQQTEQGGQERERVVVIKQEAPDNTYTKERLFQEITQNLQENDYIVIHSGPIEGDEAALGSLITITSRLDQIAQTDGITNPQYISVSGNAPGSDHAFIEAMSLNPRTKHLAILATRNENIANLQRTVDKVYALLRAGNANQRNKIREALLRKTNNQIIRLLSDYSERDKRMVEAVLQDQARYQKVLVVIPFFKPRRTDIPGQYRSGTMDTLFEVIKQMLIVKNQNRNAPAQYPIRFITSEEIETSPNIVPLNENRLFALIRNANNIEEVERILLSLPELNERATYSTTPFINAIKRWLIEKGAITDREIQVVILGQNNQPTQSQTPVEEQSPAPVSEPTPEPTPEATPEPTPEPTTEQAPQPAQQPAQQEITQTYNPVPSIDFSDI